MEDKRFDLITKDPKFRRVPTTHTKVKIDKRFQSMFQDKKFQLKYTTDKRGRPVQLHSNDDLKRYYEVSSEDEDESEDEVTNEQNSEELTDENSKALQTTDQALSDDVKIKLKDLSIDYARGEQTLQSDSSSDDEETDDEVSESEDIDHKWGELDADAGQTDEATYRLAACNLDWDRIRAVDLMVLLSSFLPSGGIIKSVVIYPSEFGKQRLQEEEVKGPIELVEAKKQPNTEQTVDDDGEEGSRYHMEKLRQYQLNRLKYYYAVVTFDSVQSANKIYTECDGMEYESSATKIDLRFIPDDMTFDDEPKESCDKLPNKYEPRFFTTTALQQAKVELTWDETNPDRLEFADKVNSGKISEISEQDLQNYLAGSDDSDKEDLSDSQSDGDSTQSGNPIDKYKALLQDIQEKEMEKNSKDVGLEISWGIDLKQKTDKLMQDKLTGQEEKTPFQKYLDKRKEKRKEHKKKSKKDESEDSDIPSDIDMNDPYFAEEFNKPEFKSKKKNSKGKKQVESEEEVDEQKQAELDLLLMNEEEGDKKHFNFKKIQEDESGDKAKKKRKKGKKGKEQESGSVKPEDEFQVSFNYCKKNKIF